MTQPSVGGSLNKGLLRIIGTVVACILGVAVIAPQNQDPLSFLLLVFGIIAVTAYLGSGSYYPYAFVIGGLTLVIIAVLAFRGQNVATSVGLSRSGEVVIGVFVSWFAAFALWPRRASLQLDEQVQKTLEGISRSFDVACDFVREGRPPPASFLPDLQALAPGPRTIISLVPQAAREGREHRTRAPQLRSLAIHLERLRAGLLPLSAPEGPIPNPLVVELHDDLDALLRATSATLETLCRRDPGAFTESAQAIRPARRSLEAALEDARTSGELFRATVQDSIAFHGLLATLRETENCLNAIGRTLFGLDGVAEASVPLRLRLSRLMLDPLRTRYAVKTALAVCFTIYLLNLLQWHAAMSALVTIFIVAQLAIGGTTRKALLRLAGAFLGAFLALLVIIFVTPYITSLQAFTLVVSFVLFFCAYAFAGPEKSAYAGLQTGLAFVIVLVAGSKQEVSIMPGITRMVGVMLGTIISIIFESALWPTHAYIELRGRVRQSLCTANSLFDALAAGLRTAVPNRETLLHDARDVLDRLAGSSALLGQALLEGRQARASVQRDLPVASAAEELLHRMSRLALRFDQPVHPSLRQAVGSTLDELLDTLCAVLQRLPSHLEAKTPDAADADAGTLRDAGRRMVAALEIARRDTRFRERPEEEVSYFVGLLDAVVRIAQGTAVTCEVLSRRAKT